MPCPKWMVLTYQLLATNLSLATLLYSHAFTLYCIVLAIVFFLKCLRFVWTSLRVQHICSRHKTSTYPYVLYTLFHTTVCCPTKDPAISTPPEQRNSDLDIWWTLSHVYETNKETKKENTARLVLSSTWLTDCKFKKKIKDSFSKS